jgi:hypothetical protein
MCEVELVYFSCCNRKWKKVIFPCDDVIEIIGRPSGDQGNTSAPYRSRRRTTQLDQARHQDYFPNGHEAKEILGDQCPYCGGRDETEERLMKPLAVDLARWAAQAEKEREWREGLKAAKRGYSQTHPGFDPMDVAE